tara:strand:- start:104 stop:505 length:402 start_codon:yes stop_codon:yes gene_type:complete
MLDGLYQNWDKERDKTTNDEFFDFLITVLNVVKKNMDSSISIEITKSLTERVKQMMIKNLDPGVCKPGEGRILLRAHSLLIKRLRVICVDLENEHFDSAQVMINQIISDTNLMMSSQKLRRAHVAQVILIDPM